MIFLTASKMLRKKLNFKTNLILQIRIILVKEEILLPLKHQIGLGCCLILPESFMTIIFQYFQQELIPLATR